MAEKGLAIVTGASSGIGYELARCAAQEGFELLICAEDAGIEAAAQKLRAEGARVAAVQADLSTRAAVERLVEATRGRPVEALIANAGIGLGGAFLEQEILDALKVVNVNVGGTVVLVHEIGRRMRNQGRGRILITGSMVGYIPGSFHAIYNASKAFLDSFAYALRDELLDSGVTVTCLMPGATDTEIFDRAGMEDTDIGQTDNKADPADVAREGFNAMMNGESGVVTGFVNKVQTMFAGILPQTLVAKMHRRMAKPHH
jgi:uncharacterized protein